MRVSSALLASAWAYLLAQTAAVISTRFASGSAPGRSCGVDGIKWGRGENVERMLEMCKMRLSGTVVVTAGRSGFRARCIVSHEFILRNEVDASAAASQSVAHRNP